MPSASHRSDRRLPSQRRLPRRADLRQIRDLHSGGDATPVLSLPGDQAPLRQMPTVWSSLTVTAATTLCAGNALPGLVLAVFSWLIAEFLAGCAAYARGMYALPPPETVVPPPADAPAHEDANLSRGNIAQQGARRE